MPHTFVKAIRADSHTSKHDDWWAVIANDAGVEEIVDDCWDTKAAAEAGGRATCRYLNRDTARDDDDWRRERANEAGMLHGIDAWNEAMGYDTYHPED